MLLSSSTQKSRDHSVHGQTVLTADFCLQNETTFPKIPTNSNNFLRFQKIPKDSKNSNETDFSNCFQHITVNSKDKIENLDFVGRENNPLVCTQKLIPFVYIVMEVRVESVREELSHDDVKSNRMTMGAFPSSSSYHHHFYTFIRFSTLFEIELKTFLL